MPTPRQRLQSMAANLAVRVAMATDGRRRWRAMKRQTADPAATQAELLQRIVAENRAVAFGRDHGFSSIGDAADYRSLVPVQTYDSLLPYIEAQELSGDGLTAQQPVLYARTSGTTGTAKDIPVTPQTVAQLSATQRLYSYGLNRSTRAFSGKVLGIGGAAIEGHRPSGKPYGSATGLIYEQMPAVVRAKYVLPPAVLGIEDYDLKYAVIAALSLAERELTSIATANPSTVVRLGDVMVDRWDELVKAVADGSVAGLGSLSGAQAAAVAGSFRPDRARAGELERLGIERGDGQLHFGRIWPSLAALIGWTGGSCGFALDGLKPRLSAATELVEYGYSASEFRGTIGVDHSRFGVPTIWDNHFEFVAVDDWEARSSDGGGSDCRFFGVEELIEGQQYYVFVTTTGGLYRYNMNDVMEAGPRFGRTPTLAFVRKGRGTTNITGEKLTEEQLLTAMAAGAAELDRVVRFFVGLADTGDARYRVFVELVAGDGAADAGDTPSDGVRLATAVDRRLAADNIEYRAKRDSGRLNPLAVVELAPGAGDAYRRALVAGGQRDAQFKHLHLQPAEGFPFDFEASALIR